MEAGLGFNFKKELPVGFLGLVDDIICVSEAGFKAQELNSFINIKTAEKNLQFGISKCRSMLVGKSTNTAVNSQLLVDSWDTS